MNSIGERYSEDVCLQTLFLLLKCSKRLTKEVFVSPANSSMVGMSITKGDVTDIFAVITIKRVVLFYLAWVITRFKGQMLIYSYLHEKKSNPCDYLFEKETMSSFAIHWLLSLSFIFCKFRSY